MSGYTVKYVRTHKVEGGVLISIEEYPASLPPGISSAPAGSPARRVDIGVFDEAEAQAMFDTFSRQYPPGVATPALT